MRNAILLLTTLGFLHSGAASAVEPDTYPIPYFGGMGSFLITDGVRLSDNALGPQLLVGVPLESGFEAVELRFSDYGFARVDGKNDYQQSLFVDYVRDFGAQLLTDEGFWADLKPYALVGAGFIKEDVAGFRHLHFGVNVGGGVLVPLGYKGWSLRFDGRVQGQANNESCDASAKTIGSCSDEAGFLVDYQIGLGLQIPMTWFYQRPITVAPEAECPLAVVDPKTGRSDCGGVRDNDNDGVSDRMDQCPGTRAGTKVDSTGCPLIKAASDKDNDGVPDSKDECPETSAGMKVDRRGCVVDQTFNLAGVAFEANSARLTAQGRNSLQTVLSTLQSQPALKVEIAGHTDNVGSATYNLLLSQRRAESVREYLMDNGIAGSRLAAVGYGEAEPVADNQSAAGRTANRRVEFRITAK